jgi:hypothetical protein
MATTTVALKRRTPGRSVATRGVMMSDDYSTDVLKLWLAS